MKFELLNEQRLYFGLEPIEPYWERVTLKGDSYREESILYFDGDTIKRHIISTSHQYQERQYNELTKSRTILLPKTSKGKDQKLTASVLESRQPAGINCLIDIYARINIANYDTHTTFYDSSWQQFQQLESRTIVEVISDFITTSPPNYLTDLKAFKRLKKKNVKFKAGDFFCFKINRTEFGFGRIMLDVAELKKQNRISSFHGLGFLMAKPVLIKIYAYISTENKVDLDKLEVLPALPSEYMMDNQLFYGEYAIIGHKGLNENDFDFPMSYGRHISSVKHCTFIQWGLIHKELPVSDFGKYLIGDNPRVTEDRPSRKLSNPYGYYSIGFRPGYTGNDIINVIKNDGVFDFDKSQKFKMEFDLRNPKNKTIRAEIMQAFGLYPDKDYQFNCKITNTPSLL